jgi:hypothetical protein
MFTQIFDPSGTELMNARLQQAFVYLRGLQYATREEYQAAVYSELNRIMQLGNGMTPLVNLPREFPAKIGDIEGNLTILNNDARALVAEIMDAENQAAAAYNLFAATQNSLRQSIRELVYEATPEAYIQAFLGPTDLAISSTTANLDYAAASASSSLISDTAVAPSSVTMGPASVGSLDASSSLACLTAGLETTTFVWNAPVPTVIAETPPAAAAELVFTFTGSPILNRITISLDDYSGLALAELTSSPDGIVREDILAALRPDEGFLSGASSKYAGEVILDFSPRTVSGLRMLFQDVTGRGVITLRDIAFSSRQYGSTGAVNSSPLTLSTGVYSFATTESNDPELGTISHQLSFDGVHFTAVQPGDTFSTPGPTWYRAQLTRNDAAFTNVAADPLVAASGRLSGQDPAVQSNYTLVDSDTHILGTSGLVQRYIDLAGASGSITLAETPLPGTLQVYFGLTAAPSGSWSYVNNAIVLAQAYPAVRIRYQISAVGASDLASRRPYYSPFLSEYSFTFL